MSVQINVHDLKNRAFELEIERVAIRELLKIYDSEFPSTGDELRFLKDRQLPAGAPVPKTTPASEAKVIATEVQKKRHYKKRVQPYSIPPKIRGTKGSYGPQTDPDRLKGLNTIGAYLGMTGGSVDYLVKHKGFPIHYVGRFPIAYKRELRAWVLTHPKYKITGEAEPASEPMGHVVQTEGSFQPPAITGRTKWIHKRCKGCNVMIHREVPEDFNGALIKFHSPECKKEWEIDHKAEK